MVDSSNHYLNYCADSVIQLVFLGFDTVYSTIRIEEEDTSVYKLFSGNDFGLDNLFYFREDGSKSYVDQYRYVEKYRDGLGLVYRNYWDFEWELDVSLLSYVKNGDTTRLLPNTIEPVLPDSEISIYPNPVYNMLNLATNQDNNIKSILIYNGSGNLIYGRSVGTNLNYQSIDFSNYRDGLYLIIIETNWHRYNRKIIKTSQ